MKATNGRTITLSTILVLLSCTPTYLFGNPVWKALVQPYGEDNFRPTTFKKHVEGVCEIAWNEVKSKKEIYKGVRTIETHRLRKNYSEKELCNCLKSSISKEEVPAFLLREERRLSYEQTLADRDPVSFKKHKEFIRAGTKSYSFELAKSQGRQTPNEEDLRSAQARARQEGFARFTSEFSRVGVSASDLTRAREITLPSIADKLYKGLKSGSYKDLSSENQETFMLLTTHMQESLYFCFVDAASKGN